MKYLTTALLALGFATLPVAADEVYVATNNGSFAEYNTTTGAYTLLGTNATVLWGMGYTSSGVLYANDSSSSPNTGLYTVNVTNGALTTVADLTGSTGGTGTLTAPNTGGTLFYFDHSNQLFTINPATGAATTIGALGFTISTAFDLDFAPNGNLYATSGGNFYEIDPSTGAGTLLGNSGAQLQALVAADGALYGFAGASMYSINLTNGQLTFIRDTPATLGFFDDGTPVRAAATSTPEPAAAFLLLGGLTLLACSRMTFGRGASHRARLAPLL